jgi:hypothetical protein
LGEADERTQLMVQGSKDQRSTDLASQVGVRVAACIAAAFVIGACSASAGSSTDQRLRPSGCTWGASSVTASYENGHVVVSGPYTTGCADMRGRR